LLSQSLSPVSLFCSVSFSCFVTHRFLHSFPTRRSSDLLDSLVSTSERLKRFIESKKIDGIEELRSDFQASKPEIVFDLDRERMKDRKSTRLNSSHVKISYAVFCLKKKRKRIIKKVDIG